MTIKVDGVSGLGFYVKVKSVIAITYFNPDVAVVMIPPRQFFGDWRHTVITVPSKSASIGCA